MVNKMAAIQYCLEVTNREMNYWLLFRNCQNFAKEILICLTGDRKMLEKTPTDARNATSLFASAAALVSAVIIGSKAIGAYQRRENQKSNMESDTVEPQ